MDGLFDYLEGLTFYGTLTAIIVAFGVWYFWWHILPKIRAYDHAKRILDDIVPKIGEDIDKIEKHMRALATSIKTMSKQYENNSKLLEEGKKTIDEYIPLFVRSFEDIQNNIGRSNRRIVEKMNSLGGRTFAHGFEEDNDDITPDVPFSIDPDSHIGESTEDILDELTIEDIKGFIRKDRTLQTFTGQERRHQPNRRSGKDRRQKTVSIRSDRRTQPERRSGRDRRQDRTIGHLQKLGKIVDALSEDDTSVSGRRPRRKSRIDDI